MKKISLAAQDALNVFILVIFSVSQPVFSILSNNVLFFVTRHSDYVEIAVFTLVLGVVVPGLVALACFLAYKIKRPFGRIVSALVIGFCSVLIIAPVLVDIEVLQATQIVFLGLIVACLVAALYFWLDVVRLFISYLLPAVVIFPLLFLFDPGIKGALGESPAAENQNLIAAPKNIVIFIFDSMPVYSLLTEERTIDAARFPNIARFSNEATWYRNASTVNAVTSWAVPSFLTGRELYGEFPIPFHSFFPENLFTTLGSQYEFHVTEYISKMCPAALCPKRNRGSSDYVREFSELLSDATILYLHSILPQDFSDRLPRINETFGGFAKGNIKSGKSSSAKRKPTPHSQLEDFVSSFRRSDKPQLYFMHVLLPHAPWRYLPSGKEYGNGYFAQIHGLNGLTKNWDSDSWSVNVAYQRHLLQVAFVDRVIGRAIDKLREEGLYDETMLIILSDHGSSYKPQDNHRNVTEGNKADLIGIPLFIKYPQQVKGSIDDRNVSIIDVLPTIFDEVGVSIDWPIDGVSLAGKLPPQRKGKMIRDLTGVEFSMTEDYYVQSESIQDKTRLLASGKSIDDLFNISLQPALNGALLSDFELVSSDDKFHIQDPLEFESVNLDSNYVPALVSGRAPSLASNTQLAVALNGKIISVTKVFSDQRETKKFAAMLPESEFRQGENILSIHRIEVNDGAFRLYDSTITGMKK